MKQSPRNTTLSPVNRTDVPLSQETQKVVVVTCGITINNLILGRVKMIYFHALYRPYNHEMSRALGNVAASNCAVWRLRFSG